MEEILVLAKDYLKNLYEHFSQSKFHDHLLKEQINDLNQPLQINEIFPIPKNLTIDINEMENRKYLNLKKWYCISRPQYSKSCGITSLVSCWNYLFSHLGEGCLPPISHEHACEILNIKPPYNNYDFGKITGNQTLITWFKRLNSTFLTRGTSKIFWKIHGKDRTIGVDEDLILKNLKQGLKSNNKSYIYHCYNHYLCILGFESTPSKPHEAYEKNLQILEKEEWIILGEVSKCYPGLLMKKWKDVVIDLNCQFPEYFNIRKSELGIQKKSGKNFNEGKYLGGNLHCIIEFSKNN